MCHSASMNNTDTEPRSVNRRWTNLDFKVIPVNDDVIKWKHFPRYWPFVRGIHRSPVNSPHKGKWRGALMFSLMCARINGWVNNRGTGDLKRHRAYYVVTVMCIVTEKTFWRNVGCTSRTKSCENAVLEISLILYLSVSGCIQYGLL